MSFQFFKNGVEISAPRRIKWRFQGHDQVFESNPEKIDINANFWRKKLGISSEVGIQIYEEGFEIKQQEEHDTTNQFPGNHNDNSPVHNGSDLEPSISEAPEATDDTSKRKTRRKTSELSDVSPELDNTDSSIDE
jgi:hypothetical protein